jgi:hypothetical protein
MQIINIRRNKIFIKYFQKYILYINQKKTEQLTIHTEK